LKPRCHEARARVLSDDFSICPDSVYLVPQPDETEPLPSQALQGNTLGRAGRAGLPTGSHLYSLRGIQNCLVVELSIKLPTRRAKAWGGGIAWPGTPGSSPDIRRKKRSTALRLSPAPSTGRHLALRPDPQALLTYLPVYAMRCRRSAASRCKLQLVGLRRTGAR
jgi:hypothetical protein